MNSSVRSKAAPAYPAAVRLFEQMTELFAVPASKTAPSVGHRKIEESMSRLKQAPNAEIAIVSAVFKEISARLDKLQAEMRAGEDAKTDALVDTVLRSARERAATPMSSERSRQDGASFVDNLRDNADAAQRQRIERKELITSKELQDGLHIRRQSVSDAVKAGRLFAIVGPSGENYYPAFYTDHDYDRRALEKVSKTLGGLPASSKYHFFTSKSHYLGSKTPLEALKEGRLDEVLIAATGFAER